MKNMNNHNEVIKRVNKELELEDSKQKAWNKFYLLFSLIVCILGLKFFPHLLFGKGITASNASNASKANDNTDVIREQLISHCHNTYLLAIKEVEVTGTISVSTLSNINDCDAYLDKLNEED